MIDVINLQFLIGEMDAWLFVQKHVIAVLQASLGYYMTARREPFSEPKKLLTAPNDNLQRRHPGARTGVLLSSSQQPLLRKPDPWSWDVIASAPELSSTARQAVAEEIAIAIAGN